MAPISNSDFVQIWSTESFVWWYKSKHSGGKRQLIRKNFEAPDYRLGEGEEAYLIFVIFFTYAKFLENKIYTEKRVNYNGFCDKIA